jgi:hypothetical protein
VRRKGGRGRERESKCYRVRQVKTESILSLIKEWERHLAEIFQGKVHPFTTTNKSSAF